MFTDRKKTGLPLSSGSYCLCPLDGLQNTFAPGRVTAVNPDTSYAVTFHDGNELYSVDKNAVYTVNKDFFTNATNFILSRD